MTETKLSYYNYRYLFPNLGRWSRQDPFSSEDENNLLCFCKNQPTHFYDNNGLETIKPPFYLVDEERKKIYVSVGACSIQLIVGHNKSDSGSLGLNSLRLIVNTASDGITKCGAVSLLGCKSKSLNDDKSKNPAPILGVSPPEDDLFVMQLKMKMPEYIEAAKIHAQNLAKYPCCCKAVNIVSWWLDVPGNWLDHSDYFNNQYTVNNIITDKKCCKRP